MSGNLKTFRANFLRKLKTSLKVHLLLLYSPTWRPFTQSPQVPHDHSNSFTTKKCSHTNGAAFRPLLPTTRWRERAATRLTQQQHLRFASRSSSSSSIFNLHRNYFQLCARTREGAAAATTRVWVAAVVVSGEISICIQDDVTNSTKQQQPHAFPLLISRSSSFSSS